MNVEVFWQDRIAGISRLRVRLLMLALILCSTTIVARLLYLTVWEGGRQLLFAETNHVDLLREAAPRGIVVDSRGRPLVKNVLMKNDKGEEQPGREYEYGRAMAPVLGYLSEVKPDEVGCNKGFCYTPGMQVGRAGVERLAETSLRGRDGGRVVEYDAAGQEVRAVGETESQPGETVKLTIDARLQQAAYEALRGRKGAVVALSLQGKVLALVSSPSYDPQNLAEALANTKDQLFLNRAMAGVYPPGSVFKPVLAYAGLMTGEIKKDDLIEDEGEIKIDNYRFGNWYFDQYGRKEGKINVVRALARSNDIFFYKLGEKLGVARIDEWAKKFGVGEPTGIELPGEVVGLLPTPLWKERTTGEKWFLGNTYHLSIGQGDLLATPLQIARMALGVVSGRRCSVSIFADTPVECQEIGLSSEAQMTVKEGMRQACAPGGTAFPFFNFDPPVLCKTGTAQHSGQKTDSDKPHAWIIVGYPAENPEMILTVFVDSAGEGSEEAAPVAKEILTKWKEMGN